MFNIYKSNKMENLMDAFASVLYPVFDDPMEPRWIGIQSRGMKLWISQQVAQRFGISANLNFVFPRQMIDNILSSADFLETQDKTMDKDFFFWSIMTQINKSSFKNKISSIENYIRDDDTGKKLFQLSMKLAQVFDDYQVYRPDMLVNWHKKKSHEILKDPVEQWQAELWKNIISKDPENHLAHKADLFLKKFNAGNIRSIQLPSCLSFFGISSLPELFVQIFEKISRLMDINLFLLVPSDQFFFDIKSARQIGKISLDNDTLLDTQSLYYSQANPLLSSLGTSGRAFFASLEALNYHEPLEDLFYDPLMESNTMLAVIQSDIFNLVLRKKGGQKSCITISKKDSSITIHACHSPMREAQVLKDILLNEFENDPELAPHDIIVMMPDIEKYAPFIESVFSLETGLPFCISDRKRRSQSETLGAFLKILALKNSRFEQSQVLDLLLSPSIAGKFNISLDEISMIEQMVSDANILWGKDGAHRQSFGLPAFEENTWHFGLQRLFMGMAMPENYENPVQDIMPCESFEGLDLEVLGKLAFFCHSLFSCFKLLSGKKTIKKWCAILTQIVNIFMDRNSSNGEDLSFLFQTIDQLKEDAQNAGFIDIVSFEMIFSLIELKLDQPVFQGNFLSGNISFCNIMPMRSIPFKIIVLMGMDENSFPRRTFCPGFDLIKKYPRFNDRIERHEDRNLFLETLLSARKKLVVTYTGMSLKDNSVIPCSGVINELMDTIKESFIFPEGYNWHFFHPLHPFNREYFNSRGVFYSFSMDNCHIAEVLNKKRPDKAGFFLKPFSKELKEQTSTITLNEMIRFFKNPVEWFMKETLNIMLPPVEKLIRDREDFVLSGLDQYTLGSFLLAKKTESNRSAEIYSIVKAMGTLPLGEQGRLEYEKIAAHAGPVIDAARIIEQKKKLPPVAAKLYIDGWLVSADFSEIREDGACFLTYGKLNGARLLAGWITHLFLNVFAPPDYPKKTIIIGRDPKGKKPVLSWFFPELDLNVHHYLEDMLKIFVQKREKPFSFFCETSWQFAQAFVKNAYDPCNPDRDMVFKAMNRSKTAWYGGYYQTGEIENRYISLCLEHNDPFENVDTLISSGFVKNSMIVYAPLLKNLKPLS